ncbi:MAG: carboxyl transferase domain-containing protein, partial [Acidimicrobiales bacterium]
RQWRAAAQEALRSVVPENRRRVYDTRDAITLIADEGSVLELRPDFGVGMVTALARVEGRPVGVIANDPRHLGGAIDAEGADKAARFLQLCNAHGLAVVTFCDTPGFMVGPESERSAQVRHFSRMFVAGAALRVPLLSVVLRKGYGLGAMAMCGGSFKAPLSTVSWPTGEFGGMGLEGAVRLGFAKELEAIADPDEQRAAFEHMVDSAYEQGKAMSAATYFEFDEVIDPADTRRHLVDVLAAAPPRPPDAGRGRFVDTW